MYSTPTISIHTPVSTPLYKPLSTHPPHTQVVDIVAVNKADGQALQAAMTTVANYTGAMSFITRRHRHWAPKVLAVSAKTGYQVDRLGELLEEYRGVLSMGGEMEEGRARQRVVCVCVGGGRGLMDL